MTQQQNTAMPRHVAVKFHNASVIVLQQSLICFSKNRNNHNNVWKQRWLWCNNVDDGNAAICYQDATAELTGTQERMNVLKQYKWFGHKNTSDSKNRWLWCNILLGCSNTFDCGPKTQEKVMKPGMQ